MTRKPAARFVLALLLAGCGGGGGGGLLPAPPPAPPPQSQINVVPQTVAPVPKGEQGAVPIVLSEPPDAPVTVTVRAGGDGSIGVTTTTFVFTPDNWNQPQTLDVYAPQDGRPGDGHGMLKFAVDGVDANEIPVVASDDELDRIPITVRDASGYGAVNYPITAVVPLKYGQFQDTDGFALVDAAGNAVPAQFKPLNRWWARDNSIRHVVIHFETTVAADGQVVFHLETAAGAQTTANVAVPEVAVTENAGSITVDTGTLRFTIDTQSFNLFDEVFLDGNGDGAFDPAERIVAPGSEGPVFTGRLPGDIQKAKDRTNLDVRVEERGPRRAVLRIESLGAFTSREDHAHGFCVRIYAYAGQSFVRVDYQLQNSAINQMKSWPLYFEDVSLHLKPDLTDPTLRISPAAGQVWQGDLGTAGRYLYQTNFTDSAVHDAADDSVLLNASVGPSESNFAWADLSDATHGVAVIVRHFAEMWPNELMFGTDHNIAVRLWPERGTMWANKELNATGLYWLDDMQHIVKQTLFWFHGPNVGDAAIETLSANFGYHPVPIIPVSQYRRTAVTFDLDGAVPLEVEEEGKDGTRVSYSSKNKDVASGQFAFGWMNFGGEMSRKTASKGGGYPDSAGNWYASGYPKRYFEWERRAYGDINCRPMWLAGYTFDDHFLTVQPSTNPGGGKSWRIFENHATDHYAFPYLDGTAWNGWYPRDNAHGWVYNVEEYYHYSGNLWVKDWYEFICEFRKRTLLRTLPKDVGRGNGPEDLFEWDFSTRAEGHLMANAWQAYRVTGDAQLLEGLKNRIKWLKEQKQLRQWGHVNEDGGEAAFQIGYLARAVLNYLTELKGHHPEAEQRAFCFLWGLMDWNFEHSQFSYYITAHEGEGPEDTSGTSLTLVDPCILWYRYSGQRKIRDLTFEYVANGLRGGVNPYGHWSDWEGGWPGRAYWAERLQPKPNDVAPAAVGDLSAAWTGDKVRIEWTAPADATRYLVVWSDTPISRVYTDDAGQMNFWYANVVPQTLAAAPGQRQNLEFEADSGAQQIYVALVAFSADSNMSEVSNVAVVNVP